MVYMITRILESRQKTMMKRVIKMKKIDITLTGEKNATNENNENVAEIDLLFMYPFLFQIVLKLKEKCFSLIIF